MSFSQRIGSLRMLFFAWVLVALSVCPLFAQVSTNPESPQNGNPRPIPLDPSKAEPVESFKPGDWLYLPGENGKLQPAPAVDVAEFLRWREKGKPEERPLYSFSNVSITGTASDDTATVTVSLSLQILDPDEWVRVPLGLNEGDLREFEHRFEPAKTSKVSKTDGREAFASFDGRGGYDWWFKGQGQHALDLEMTVELRKTSGMRRLQLAVPSAASSYLQLNLPISKERLSLETVVAGAHKVHAREKNQTEVELFRLGPRLDFAWRTLPDTRQVETQLSAETLLRVEPTVDSILLQARQFIEPLQGSMSEVEISLPKDFAVLELNLDGEPYRVMGGFEDGSESVKIELPAATTSRIRLDWILQAPWPGSGQVVVEGFQVGDSLGQKGKMEIVGLEGYRIVKRSATNVVRINARELLGPGPIFSAYQFGAEPFQLALGLQQIEPSYSVRPHLFLKMGEKQIEMLLDLELDVFRGVVQTLEMDWPGFEEQGWAIDEATLPGEVEQIERDPETGRTAFQLAKRIGQGTTFRLPIRARRELTGMMEQKFPLTLPRAIAPNRLPTVVVVTNQENVETRFTPAGGTETQPLHASLTEEVDLLLEEAGMRDFLGRRRQDFLVPSAEHGFAVEVLTHPQSIESEGRVRIFVSEGEANVRQTLQYNVEYEPASKLSIAVPASFPASAGFFLGEVPLPLEWIGPEDETPREARLTLPEPMLNAFEIIAEYKLSEKGAEARQIKIPLVRSLDAQNAPVRLEFVSDYQPEVTVSESAWTKTADPELAHVWTSSKPGDVVTIQWTPRRESDIQSFTVRSSQIRSVVQRQGQIYSVAEYQFGEAPEELLISLSPEEIRPDAFYWNGEQLSVDQVGETESGSGLFRLQLPDSGLTQSAPASLAVAYHTPNGVVLNWHQDFELAAPAFPGDVWMEKTVWDVTLPVDQHMFSPPGDFAPEFSWTRQGFFWSRVPGGSSADSASWTGFPDSRASELFPSEGNTYRFSYVGPTPTLRFSSMNRSMVVLFGAGLALLCGFVLLKIPATRNVLTVLFVLFAFALAGVWYAAPMRLLIQPAFLGLLLAVVAVLLDSSFKRGRSPSLVPMSNAGDFSGSSAPHAFPGYPEPIGSEDPTAVRQNAQRRTGSSEDPQSTPDERTVDHAHSEFVGSSVAEKPE